MVWRQTIQPLRANSTEDCRATKESELDRGLSSYIGIGRRQGTVALRSEFGRGLPSYDCIALRVAARTASRTVARLPSRNAPAAAR